jgi:hypothetical protein
VRKLSLAILTPSTKKNRVGYELVLPPCFAQSLIRKKNHFNLWVLRYNNKNLLDHIYPKHRRYRNCSLISFSANYFSLSRKIIALL